jgi:hypothetical protein
MKHILLAVVLFAGLSAAFACPARAWFPHDAINEERAQIFALMQEVRGVLEAQRELIMGLPPEKRDDLLSKNEGMTDRVDRMMTASRASAGRFVPPYAESYELGSFLRSALRPIR